MKSKVVLVIGLSTSAIFFALAAPVLTDKWQINTSNGQKIPSGWEPFSIDSFDKQDPFLLRRSSSAKWDPKQKWEIKTAGLKIPVGWEPFAYDSKDQFDPFLLRQRVK